MGLANLRQKKKVNQVSREEEWGEEMSNGITIKLQTQDPGNRGYQAYTAEKMVTDSE